MRVRPRGRQGGPFPDAGFDAVVSRAGIVLRRPAGRLRQPRPRHRPRRPARPAHLAGPARNEWFVEITGALAGRPFAGPPPGVPSPFALADPDAVTRLLGGAGFTDVQIADVHEPARFGAIRGRPDVMAELLAGCSTAGTPRRRGGAARHDRAHEGADGITFGSAAWLVTAVRTD